MKKKIWTKLIALLCALMFAICGCTYVEIGSSSNFNPSMLPEYKGQPYAAVNNNIPFFEDDELTAQSYESYVSLDRLGRCGVCVASVGRDIMPTEKRGEIGNVKPSGWKQEKYAGLVDGNFLYNRSHLIGFQLTGENANEKNLITGTRHFNVEGMLPFENMVADYVKETGNHVLYRVTPIFEGNNLVASGVLMEAKSVEDNGEGVLFCVYAFNVQPGITIDYSDGSSWLSENENKKEKDETCWATKSGSKYHAVNDCGRMNPKNALKLTIKEAQKKGLEACTNCW